MKSCQPHWDKLRADIDKYGLSHLVPQDGFVAAQLLAKEISGEANPIDFDPLMSAYMQLTSAALNFVGSKVLFEADSCPACELAKYDWVEGAAYQSRIFAEKNGLLIETQAGEQEQAT